VTAGLLGAALSGIPSTVHALATGADPLDGARAAGAMLLPREERTAPLLVAATGVHLAISLGWAAVLARVLPPGRATRWSAPAALGIAALDLGLIGRRFPRIHALPALPQLADHLAYGLTVGAVLDLRAQRPRTC
jgi:hypothetical protein